MVQFDKCQAMEVIEDALTDIDTPHGRGVATGLCGAFYMCGLLSKEEWEGILERIPVESDTVDHYAPLPAQSRRLQDKAQAPRLRYRTGIGQSAEGDETALCL